MNDKKSQKLSHPLEIYLTKLTTIKDIRLTQREVDVISCLLHMGARTRKYIANLLFIDFKTVNLHISNAAHKLIGYCNVDRMIAFLESSDQNFFLKTYYLSLVVDNLFKKTLKKDIKPLIDKNVLQKCVLVYWQKKPHFLENLKKDLISIGLEVSVESRKGAPFFNELIQEPYHDIFPIYFLPATLVERHPIQEGIQEVNHSSCRKIFFLSQMKNLKITPQEFSEFTFISPSMWSSYYSSVFVILKKIMPNLALSATFARFEEKVDIFHTFPFSLPPNTFAKKTSEARQPRLSKKINYALIGIFIMGTFFLWDLSKDRVNISNKQFANLEKHSIRSELIIPAKSTLLNRSKMMAQIDRHFEKPLQDIETLALVGVGGSGKTTLARHYARSQNLSVIWEINAETKNSIKRSFENLVYALLKTDKEKEILRNWQSINNTAEQERKIIELVKGRLKLCAGWLLIYDNVENLKDIQKYFPSDSKTWGTGRIIITTNDANIRNNRQVNHVIPIKELDGQEKLQLFMSIMSTANDLPFSLTQKEQAHQFLNFIPSYPLDISIAAYYLKTTEVSYEKYLNYMEAYSASFDKIQKKFLKSSSDYTKTRYYIIASSIKRLIEENEDIKGLILFISLLDSQNIPKELLSSYYNSIVADNFLYSLKQYSLITHESPRDYPVPFISIHRSTQAISLNYLSQVLDLNKNHPLLQKIVHTLENYMDKAILDENDILNLKNHCEVFFSHAHLLTEGAKASLRCMLGMVYCYRGRYEKSKNFLEENLTSLNRNDSRNFPVLARTFGYLGMVYRLLGDFKTAKKYLEQSLVLYQHCKPINDIKIAWILQQLGIVYKEVGDFETAKKSTEDSLIIYRKHLPKNHLQIALTLSTLGIIYKNHSNYKKAKDLLEQSLAIYKEKLSANHMRVAWVLSHLGENEQEAGNYEKAKKLLEQSLKIYKDHSLENHICPAWALATLGNIYVELGDAKSGGDLLEKSLIIYRSHFSEDHIEIARIFVMLAKTYIKLEYLEKAKNFLERALLIYEKNSHKNHIDYALALKVLGQVYFYERKLAITEKYFRQALKMYRSINHPDIYKALEDLADLYNKKSIEALNEHHIQQSENFKIQAIKYIKEAREIVIDTFFEDSPHIARISSKIKKIEYN